MAKTTLKEYMITTCEPEERLTTRLMRFAIKTGVSLPTLHKALKGAPVSRLVASKLAEASDGELQPEWLVFPPKQQETRNDQR